MASVNISNVTSANHAFICDVAYAYCRVNECRSWVYEPRRSKIGSSKEIVGECKYYKIKQLIHKMTSHHKY